MSMRHRESEEAPRMKRVRNIAGIFTSPIVLLVLLAMATPAAYGRLESAFPYTTPTPVAEPRQGDGFLEDATLIGDGDLRRYVWDTDTGSQSLTPVSLTVMVDDNGMWLVGELRNETASFRTVPSLIIEASAWGTSIGQQEVHSLQRFVGPGQSALYMQLLYQGAVQPGEWELTDVWADSSQAIGDPAILPHVWFSLEEQRVYNDGTVDVGTSTPVALHGVARDTVGHFVGYCSIGEIPESIPAGMSAPLPESIELPLDSTDACDALPFDVSIGLGTMPIAVEEYLVIP
jgi:hypothetical protein